MKTSTSTLYLFLMLGLITVLGSLLAGPGTAQTFTTLHDFTATSDPPLLDGTNMDGASPNGGLTLWGETLYGTTQYGGSYGSGTVFKVKTDGAGFTTLYSFTATDPSGRNSDGANPSAGLILSNNTLYGTTAFGGNGGSGTVFAVHTNGTSFTNLHTFTPGGYDFHGVVTNSDGMGPVAALILSGNTLYGTASAGGSLGGGTVFAVHTDGTDFRVLHNSTGDIEEGVVLSGTTLYGTTYANSYGSSDTVFAVNTDGTGFTNLHSFTARDNNGSNSDGVFSNSGLVLWGKTLYGTAALGGSLDAGTLFAVNTDGTGFANLHSFTGGEDGSGPFGLFLSGDTLYGTTFWADIAGPYWNSDTIFSFKLDGTSLTTLHHFSTQAFPHATLISGNTFYGTTVVGGSAGSGTLFSLFIAPQLKITPSHPNVILTWPTNATGFTLQSKTTLDSFEPWTAVSPGPVVISGLNTVTNPITNTQQFYRLRKCQQITFTCS